jgi:hypothetical protein
MSYEYRLLAESFPVARKQHRCIWCGEPILRGEKYRHERSVYNGEMQDHKWHLECDADFAEGLKYDPGNCEFTPHSSPRPERAASAAAQNN